MTPEESKALSEKQDWSRFTWPVSQTLGCRCGTEFRSHAQIVEAANWCLVSKDPCPVCGHYANIRSSASDPSSMTVERREVQKG